MQIDRHTCRLTHKDRQTDVGIRGHKRIDTHAEREGGREGGRAGGRAGGREGEREGGREGDLNKGLGSLRVQEERMLFQSKEARVDIDELLCQWFRV
jgi:hypothetical protein